MAMPPGNQVGFEFTVPWYVPPGSQVGFDFGATASQNIDAEGWDSVVFGLAILSLDDTLRVEDATVGDQSAFGDHSVAGGPATVLPAGLLSQVFGIPYVRNLYEVIRPPGWLSQLIGNPSVSLRTLFPSGIAPGPFGTAWISHLDRTITPPGYFNELFGVHQFAGGVRWIDLTSRGIAPGPFGTAFVAWRQREVFPSGFQATFYGTPLMGFEREIAPAGFDATQFGLADIKDNRQYAGPQGIAAPGFGLHDVQNWIRTLRAFPIGEPNHELKIGAHELTNMLGIIHAGYIQTQWNEGGVGAPALHNRNRTVDLIGNGVAPPFRQVPWDHEIHNNARLLAPPGIDAFASTGNMVAHAIRYIQPEGYHRSVSITHYHVVFNDARVVGPVGFDALSMDAGHWLLNTRRWLYHIGAGQQDEHGTPFVAFAERGITQDRPFQRFPIPAPTIWHSSRTIEQLPPPFPNTAFGVATLEERFTIIKPMSIASTWRWGVPVLHKVTPEITPYGPPMTEWGAMAVFNRWNYLPAEGFNTQEFGATHIAYRTKTIFPLGIDGFRDNKLHHIYNNTPDPPGPQPISVPGIDVVAGHVPTPMVSDRGIRPAGFESRDFGDHAVRFVGARPMGIPPVPADHTMQFGIPSLNATRIIWIDETQSIVGDIGRPSLNPRTIWAPIGAPQQAMDNHPVPNPPLHPIDYYLYYPHSAGMPVFGVPDVQNFHRIIEAESVGVNERFGVAELFERPIYVRPPSINAFRPGFPTVSRHLEAKPFGFDAAMLGLPFVGHVEPFIRYLTVEGLYGEGLARIEVMHFHRELPVGGILSQAIGQAWVQRPPPPAEPPGFDATQWGDGTFIDFRIRYRAVQGWDNMEMTWTPGHFNNRMRVWAQTTIWPADWDSAGFGSPTLEDQTKGVLVGGIAPPPVPPPVVVRFNNVSLAGHGFTTEAHGDTWAWAVEDGLIRVRGDDMSGYGWPALARTIDVAGLTGAIGDPIVGPFIGVPGWDSAEYGEPVIVAFGCGTQARALDGWDSASVGTAGIGHAA